MSAASLLAPTITFAQPAAAPAPELIALPTVTGTQVSLGGCTAPENSTALRMPAAAQDVPVSIRTVTPELIRDRQALTIRQAIETVSGVESSNLIPGSLAFRTCGFVDSGSSLRDGFREQSNQQDIQGVERIDVLKGPAAVLYGSALSSGGIVNLITKSSVGGAAS